MRRPWRYSVKQTSAKGLAKASVSALTDVANQVNAFTLDARRNSVSTFVANPVNDIVVIAGAGRAVGIWTGVGTIPCAAVYTFLVVQGGKAIVLGSINAAIDKSSMTAADKTYWKNMAKSGNCVVSIFTLDAASAFSATSGAFSCASAVSSTVKDTQNRKHLSVVSSNSNGTVTGFVLIQK